MSDPHRAAQVGTGRATLLGGAILTSRLGYGTSTLMGRVSRRDSRLALDTAYAAGITHFDTARAYGYGEAEGAVGAFIRDKRDRVTIATKAGIVPPRRSASFSVLRAAARSVVAVMPGLRRTLRATAARSVARGKFDSASIESSLETSLRELATDYVDVFLLHECSLEDLTEGLLETLQRFVKAGKIRAFGVATQPDISRAILEQRESFAAVVQVADSIVRPMRVPPATTSIITHSIFAGGPESILDRLPKRESLQELNLSARTLARRAMLEYALRSNATGITLFSSTNPAHITENVRNVADPVFTADELDRMAQPSVGHDSSS